MGLLIVSSSIEAVNATNTLSIEAKKLMEILEIPFHHAMALAKEMHPKEAYILSQMVAI